MRKIVTWWDNHQIPLYLFAIILGVVMGLKCPNAVPVFKQSTNLFLGALLFTTFLGVPLAQVGTAFRDSKFLCTILIANFLITPIITYVLSHFVLDNRGLMLGVLLVLLTPCIDYVIVFTGLAGGANARLLAAAPLLILVQILLLPVYLVLFVGSNILNIIDFTPFLAAFITFIVIPFIVAVVIQSVAKRYYIGYYIETLISGVMVPVMMVTLIVVVGSHIAAIGEKVLTLARIVPLYIIFVVLATVVGKIAAHISKLDVPATRAIIFSVITRNSLVILPLALALPATFGMVPLAVITQTLVELIAMVIMVRIIPIIVPEQ